HEYGSSPLPRGDERAHQNLSALAHDSHDIGVGDAETLRIAGMDFGEGFGEVLRQARARSGPRHGVPMVAHAARVQNERKSVRRLRRGRTNRDDARAAVARVETAGAEEPRLGGSARPRSRPLEGAHPVVALPVDAGESSDIEIAFAVILEGR